MPKALNKLLTQLEDSAKYFAQQCADHNVAMQMVGDLDLDPATGFNVGGCSTGAPLWIHTQCREDVEKILSLAPEGKFWTKASSTNALTYTCEIAPGRTIQIYAQEGALPPTCILEEIDVIVPATPERTEKRKVLKCKGATPSASDQPISPSSDTPVVTPTDSSLPGTLRDNDD